MAILPRLLIAITALLGAGATYAQALGVVMMHGKWGTLPPWHTTVSRSIEHEGWPVIELAMPWAGNRLYDAPYESALKQIADAVKELRAKGVKRVIVGGHSFGANAAIAYAGSGGDSDGILAMASGHLPRSSYNNGTTKDTVDQARQLMAAGRGNEILNFIDTNQGKRRTLRARADIFLSYFDPEGLGDIPTSMAHIGKPLPLMWLVGTGDQLFARGQVFAYDRAPLHPLSRYVVVEADHLNTPSVGREQVIEWLKTITMQP